MSDRRRCLVDRAPMNVIVSVTSARAPLRVTPRSDLTKATDLAVAIGHAPDGLPLGLQITRSCDVRQSVASAIAYASLQLTPPVESALEVLQRVVGSQAIQRGMGEVQGRKGYTTGRPIGTMLGDSLLARALGDVGPLGPHTYEGGDRAAATRAGVVMTRYE